MRKAITAFRSSSACASKRQEINCITPKRDEGKCQSPEKPFHTDDKCKQNDETCKPDQGGYRSSPLQPQEDGRGAVTIFTVAAIVIETGGGLVAGCSRNNKEQEEKIRGEKRS